MARLCLPKTERDKLATALKSGDVHIRSLYDMTSEQRNTLFAHYVGDSFASIVNAKFEAAMVSKQKDALRKWVERSTTQQAPIRRDMLKKVDRIKSALTPDEQRGFLRDLAADKLGINISESEAAQLLQIRKQIDDARKKIPDEYLNSKPVRMKDRPQSVIEYGFAVDDFKTFVGDLKREANELTVRERLSPQNYWKQIKDAANITKSLVATLDNSFMGRQGIKTLMSGRFNTWAQTAANSFLNMGRELTQAAPGLFKSRSDAVMRAQRADIWSRPNALNGKYTAAKNGYGLGILHEETFPTSIPERIPLLGRVFKASETAFNGSALRMRADLADAFIAQAERNGIDVFDEAQASGLGSLVGSMTGRGGLGKLETAGSTLNALMFSPRFLAANFNTLTGHLFDNTMTPYARKKAIENTLRIAAGIGTTLAIAKMIDPDSVDFDARGSGIGKIKIGDRRYDISGGMGGLVTFGSRMVPTYHNGEWGFWTKNAQGKYTKMTGEKYGERTALDTFEQFFEGKLSPAAGVLRDIWRGQNFAGEKPDVVNTTLGLITPISAEMLIEELKKGSDDLLLAMLAESVGVSPSSATLSTYSKQWGELKEKVSDKKLNDHLKEVTANFNKRAKQLEESPRWKRMNNDERSKELDKIRREETDRVMSRYGI